MAFFPSGRTVPIDRAYWRFRCGASVHALARVYGATVTQVADALREAVRTHHEETCS